MAMEKARPSEKRIHSQSHRDTREKKIPYIKSEANYNNRQGREKIDETQGQQGKCKRRERVEIVDEESSFPLPLPLLLLLLPPKKQSVSS